MFSIDVEVHNVGASWTKGGVYVSGYDPSLFEVYKPINKDGSLLDNCRLNIDPKDGWSAIGGFLSCNLGEHGSYEVGSDSNSDNWIDQVNVRDGLAGLAELFGWGDVPEVNFNWDRSTDSYNMNFDFSKITLDYDQFYHGQALLVILQSLTFDSYHGNPFRLAPDNYQFPGGESDILSFPGYIKHTWPPGMDQTDVTFLVTSCYAYSTFATPLVCIDPNPFSEDEKICRPGEVRMSGSQGAPIAVTRVYEEASRNSAIFTIEIQNIGNGKVYDPGHLKFCSPYYPGYVGPQSLDKVIVGDVRLSGSAQPLVCTPDDRVGRLRDGRGIIPCRYDYEYNSAKSAYRAPLVIELWYGYSETQRRNVYVKRVT
jgi:hypothetical protein